MATVIATGARPKARTGRTKAYVCLALMISPVVVACESVNCAAGELSDWGYVSGDACRAAIARSRSDWMPSIARL
jgi:hypothetical protein